MQAELYRTESHADYYGMKFLGTLIVLLMLLAYASFYLIQNYYSKSFLDLSLSDKKVYLLKSTTLKRMYERNGMDYDAYKTRLQHFETLASDNGYKSEVIYSDALKKLPKESKLIALDMMSLSSDEIDNIDSFVTRGGRLIYNFTSGFLDESLKYQSDNLVSRISHFKLDPDINTVQYDKNNTGYMSTKLLSPLTNYLPLSRALELVMYDPLPIFDTPNGIEADAYLTNWSQINYLVVGKNRELDKKQAGLVWHGYKGLGKWVYFSFPSYSMMEAEPSDYANFFKGMLEYLDKDIVISAYPYIDAKNVVFVSEDTEYKFENLQQFYNIAQKYKFPVTAFCVGNLAQEHKELMKKVSSSKYVEIGSHSYSHKKIVGTNKENIIKETKGSRTLLEKLSNQNVYGFRPPREELSKMMLKWLDKGGFKYIEAEGENRLTPYMKDDLLIIPRHGTDDYSYFINLDWDSKKILEEMKHQVNVLVDLNGIYTMSTHTHLMSFSSNINIEDKFFAYVKSHRDISPMNGIMIYNRVTQKANLSSKVTQTSKKIIMTVNNNNAVEIKNMHYSIVVDSNVVLKNVQSEIIGVQTQLKKVSQNEYTLIVKSMKPKSQLVLFINYDKTY